jgi:hypothetical protein
MPVSTTYTPEAVKLTVADHLVTGYQSDSSSFIAGDESFFKVYLHWGSDSIEPLRSKRGEAQKVKFEAGLSRGVYVDGEFLVSHNTPKGLDFTGEYSIEGPYFEYTLDGVFVQFNFVKV